MSGLTKDLLADVEAEFGGKEGAVQALREALATLPPRRAQLLRRLLHGMLTAKFAPKDADPDEKKLRSLIEHVLETSRPTVLLEAKAVASRAQRIAVDVLERVERIERHLNLESDT